MKISCFMATTESRRWVIPLAIRCFQRQVGLDPGNLELVVASEHESVADLIPRDDPRIRFELTPNGISLGEKHNVAVERCRYDWLAKWDDDDWHAPHKLATTSRMLTGALIAGPTTLIYHKLLGDTWRYRYQGNAQAWVAGNALVFHRKVWEKTRFPDRPRGVDTIFAQQAVPQHPTAIVNLDLVVVLQHGQTTGGRVWPPRDSAYSPLPASVVWNHVGDDLALYERAFEERER